MHRRQIESVMHALERYGQYRFRDSFITISRTSTTSAMESYKRTLLAKRPSILGEPLSATMMESATVSWSTEPTEVGANVRQVQEGVVRPRMRELVDLWYKAGKPFPSGGGFYLSVPNKSYEKVLKLSKLPELRDIVRRLDAYEDWLAFWELFIQIRMETSEQLLAIAVSGKDPEVLSRGNAAAGTGLSIKGRRLTREDLASNARHLDFLIPYMRDMMYAFAAVQMAELPFDQVFVITVTDPRIRGAIAARSAFDPLTVRWNGYSLSIEGISETRQAGTDCTGVLTNAKSESRYFAGQSVTERVLRAYKPANVHYPFTDKGTVLDAWATDAWRGAKRYIIGEDLGLSEPFSAPADSLFSRAFIDLSGRVLPCMLSGSTFTQAVYAVFHRVFSKRFAPGDVLLALGDDMNLLTSTAQDEIFTPYVKVKGTDETSNTKKILGMYSKFPHNDNPNGRCLVGVVPRVLKSESSASLQSRHWATTFAPLVDVRSGRIDLRHDDATEELMREGLGSIIPYLGFATDRSKVRNELERLWGKLPRHVESVLSLTDPDYYQRIGAFMTEENINDD